MKVKSCISCLITAALPILTSFPLEGAIVIQNGKIQDADSVATLPVQEHFKLGLAAFEKDDFSEAMKQMNIVVTNFPGTPQAIDGCYYLGVAYFHLGDYDFANVQFSDYLKQQRNPKFFEQSIQHKLAIAEKFKEGARKHLLDTKYLPKWGSAKKLAISVFDEVIAAMPCSEIAAKALYEKADLHWTLGEYREAVDNYQVLIKRFPKHELAIESYLAIIDLYIEQSKVEFQNPDILALAQINLKRFSQDFPKEERVKEAVAKVNEIKEIYARGLYDTGRFYERVKKPEASILYYRKAMHQFPDTEVAQACRERLNVLYDNKDG